MRAWLEVDLAGIDRNFQAIQEKIGRTVAIIAVVKSDAYGLGLEPVVQTLDRSGAQMFAVISLQEAKRIRRVSKKPVLILGFLEDKEIAEAIENGFNLSLYENKLAPLYERLAGRVGKKARIHLKVDTGLNRLGVSLDQAAELLTSQRHFPHLSFEAVFSHLYSASNRATNLEQLERIRSLILKIGNRAELLPIHLTSSAAIANFPEGYFDAVRVGAMLYWEDGQLPIEEVVRCKSVVMQVKEIGAGEGVSYDHQFIASKPMRIAVVGIGYAEGYRQIQRGSAAMLINGERAKVLGRVCMNYTVVELGQEPVKRGDEVVVLGQQLGPSGKRGRIELDELAKWFGLSHHEVITGLGIALPKVYEGLKGGNNGRSVSIANK